MKKKTYFNSNIPALVFVLIFFTLSVGGCVYCIYEWVRFTNPTIKWAFFVYPVCVICLLLSIFFLWLTIEFVVIDEEKIVSRHGFGKYGNLKWQNLKEVKLKVSASDKLPYEIEFVNKTVDLPEKGKTEEERSEADYMNLKYSKKREQFLKQLKPYLIFIVEVDKNIEITEEK